MSLPWENEIEQANSTLRGPGWLDAVGGQQIYTSADGGQTWEKLAEPLPFTPNALAYSGQSKSIYAWRSTEKKVSDAVLRWGVH